MRHILTIVLIGMCVILGGAYAGNRLIMPYTSAEVEKRQRAELDKKNAESQLNVVRTSEELFQVVEAGACLQTATIQRGGPQFIAMAISDLDKCISKSPNNPFLYLHRASFHRLNGSFPSAFEDIEASIRRKPTTRAFLDRADLYRLRGEYGPALKDLEQVLSTEASPESRTLFQRGLTYEKLGDTKKARADYQQISIKVIPQDNKTDIEIQQRANARLAAIDSGASQPIIAPMPAKRLNPTSLPTPVIAVPKPSHVNSAERRVALVIGNSAYQFMSALENPRRDADTVSAALRNIGFTVFHVVDGNRDALRAALSKFASAARKADWSMIYFAGHGIEVDGKNYLIPVDGRLAVDRNVSVDTIELSDVIAATEGASGLKLIVLDACRDNPFLPAVRPKAEPVVTAQRSSSGGRISLRSSGDGLAEVKVSGATLVVYAAKHGQSALDGDGKNSPFAVAFVQRLATPGVEVNKIFRLVRDDVIEATGGRQEPFTYGSLPGRQDFFFVPKS